MPHLGSSALPGRLPRERRPSKWKSGGPVSGWGKGFTGFAIAVVVALGILATGGVFHGTGERPASQTAIKIGGGVGIPGIGSLGDLADGVSVSALPSLRTRGRMETIMQDDATFIYGASGDA